MWATGLNLIFEIWASPKLIFFPQVGPTAGVLAALSDLTTGDRMHRTVRPIAVPVETLGQMLAAQTSVHAAASFLSWRLKYYLWSSFARRAVFHF